VKISCLIVDDEPLARNLLADYVQKIEYLHLVGTCANALEALNALKKQPVDLLFLDVQMPELTGISFLKTLHKKPLVILTTAYSQYALEGYELDVTDYLLKPITFDRFLKAAEKVSARLNEKNVTVAEKPADTPDYIFVKDGTKLVKVKWADILYIEGLKDYVTIHTQTHKVVTLQRMKALEEQMPAHAFIRIHNSYIVAVAAIGSVQKEKVQIGDTFLPIGDTYRKAFKDFIEGRQVR
jgi:DNA-binding LytR/AlgR family response regulator